jgi:hypothetical protein
MTETLMDELLRGGVPEIKYALGDVIDRENARPLPARYARLMPDTILRVTLRADAAEALLPIAGDLERELTDSCNRHGSLYDRSYRVQLQRTDDPDAPLYTVSSHAGKIGEAVAEAPKDRADGNLRASPAVLLPPAGAPRAVPAAAKDATSGLAPEPLPLSDDDTRIDFPTPAAWEDGRWVLVVEGDGGEELEVFRIASPMVTVGRGTDDPTLRASIAISDAPHVSRRQLALVWEERDGAPGFKVFNLGLNTIHLPGLEIPGARAGKGEMDLSRVPDEHTGWLAPGVPLRIGEHGPTLRIDEVPPGRDDVWIDPDATVYE